MAALTLTLPSYAYSLTASSAIARSDGALIPPDPANQDYQQYLAWVAAGHAATPYVPPPPPVSMTSGAFFQRFTPAEAAAVWKVVAADATGTLGAALIHGISGNSITPTDATVTQWLAGLVAAGALSSARAAAIGAAPTAQGT